MRDHKQITDDLVLYALRELSEPDTLEVRSHLAECAHCRRELGEINSDMALLALASVAANPPLRSRERLLSAIKAEPRRMRMVVMHRPWRSFVPSFAAVLLAVFGLMLWRDNVSLRHRLEVSQEETRHRQVDLDRAKLVVDALTSPDSGHFTLVGTQFRPVPQARASYMQKTGTLVFTAEYLQALPQQKTYQLWLIPADGSAPIPCGMFKPDEHGNASLIMPRGEKKMAPKMFAVTIEPEGGSETPTMPIVMAGV